MEHAQEYAWLVYMAGENSLEERVNDDLKEMKDGLSDLLSVDVHTDRPEQNSTHITLGRRDAPPVRDLGEDMNAGEARTLTEFLRRGKNGAKYHVACIWGHAYGWIGAAFDEAGRQPTTIRNSRKAMMAASRGLFRTSVVQTVQNAAQTNVDETARDFLDMSELRKGLRDALDGKDQFAIIGCDACYMAMLEVAYEIRHEGQVLVASEEEEEPDGWNYTDVFQKFEAGLEPAAAATKIVEAYEPQTRAEPRATLSAIKLDEMGEVADAVNALGALLTPLIATPWFEAIKRARANVHTFKLYHYIDLYHFAECLQAALGDDKAVEDVWDAAADVIKAVKGAVIATQNGAAAANAHGMAVYLPNEPVNPNYAKLALAEGAPKWAEFVTIYGNNR